MLAILRISGVLYLFSALWCVFQADAAARFLELGLNSSLARSEFFSVYGGLQAGLGVAMLLCSYAPRYVEAALFFSATFSGCLALFRLLSCVIYGWTEVSLVMLAIELGIAMILAFGWWKIAPEK